MSLVNSPKIKYDAKGAQERVPVRVLMMRGATYMLLGLSAVLFLVIWLGGDVVSQALGRTGVVQGVIVNEQGVPVAGSEISLSQTTDAPVYTDANGYFVLRRVPVGTQSILVSVGRWAQEYPVTIQRRTMTDAGILVYLMPPTDD